MSTVQSEAKRRRNGGAIVVIAIVIALVLAWRVVVTGADRWRDEEGVPPALAQAAPEEVATPERQWRTRLTHNPADYVALVMLALEFEQQGRKDDAHAAMREALRLAPADRQTLLQAGALLLRGGDVTQALPILQRAADLYPQTREAIWPAFARALDGGRHDEFFTTLAVSNVSWWPEFFRYACQKSKDSDALQRVFAKRTDSHAADADGRRCLVDRLLREQRWASGYQVWLNSLPADQRQRIGFVFNGDFELPISNLGFDWTITPQAVVVVEALPTEGAAGRRALKVEFVNQRWAGTPVQQRLMLVPGRYRFDGRGRSVGLDTWLGVQWGIYCLSAGGATTRQLTRIGRFRGTTPWEEMDTEFTVPPDCPAQVLRLELANPRAEADTPGNVAARLRGTVWFDDFRVRSVE